MRCARGCEPTDVTSSAAAAALLGGSKPEEKLGYFAVPTRVDGLLGKVGLSSGKVHRRPVPHAVAPHTL